jgi:hypothetical protein
MAKRKATHQGTCQCCGRLQKLPGGFLSKHGYTVDWGYFNGVCGGAHHLPLEQDRTIVDAFVVRLREGAKYARENDPGTLFCDVARSTRWKGRRSVREGGEVAFDDFEAFEALALENESKWQMQGWKAPSEYLTEDRGEKGTDYYFPGVSLDEQKAKTIREEYAYARYGALSKARANAVKAEAHADFLVRHADEVHGKPLRPVSEK